MMGPYSKANLWTAGASQKLGVPDWARDADGAGLSRNMDIPCSGSKLKGDMKPPFTCGSDTRRSIIKYFVREYMTDKDGLNNHVEQLIRERIQKLIGVWNDTSKFPCLCADGTHALTCCRMVSDSSDCVVEYDTKVACVTDHNFSPSNLNISFDQIEVCNT